MNDHTLHQENAEPAKAPGGTPPPAGPRPARMADALSHISLTHWALAGLIAVFLWQWQAGHSAISDMREQLAKKIAEMDGGSKAGQILLTQSQDQVRELSAKVALLEARFAETQNQRAALEALYTDMSVSRDEAALAEVEQMLLIAAQQLQLSGNIKVAVIALQSADARLQRMNRPAFDGLRKSIGRDIEKLRALPDVDIGGIASQLENLISAIDGLPLAYQQRATVQAASQSAPSRDETRWQGLLREIGDELKQLVRIENTGKPEIPLLPPDQAFFLRENLKLRLMSARFALISRDEENFKHELMTAQLWTSRYFDVKSDEGARMLSGLKKLAGSSVSVELPDVGQSLQAVRSYRLARESEPRAKFEARPRVPKAGHDPHTGAPQ
jgi:uroporphyrin-3 C-methyltransferase